MTHEPNTLLPEDCWVEVRTSNARETEYGIYRMAPHYTGNGELLAKGMTYEVANGLVAIMNTRHPVQQAPASDGLRAVVTAYLKVVDTDYGHAPKDYDRQYKDLREAQDNMRQAITQPATPQPTVRAEDVEALADAIFTARDESFEGHGPWNKNKAMSRITEFLAKRGIK